MREPRRLVVVSPNWLGDAVMAMPALADVRRAWPQAHLAVAARASVASVFGLARGIDHVVTLGSTGASGRSTRRDDVERLRALHFDTAILLPNSFASAWLVWRAGIGQRWGYRGDWRRWLLTRSVPKPAESVHQGTYYQRLVHGVGVPNGPLEAVLAATSAHVDAARELLGREGWTGTRRLVAIAPGAAYGTAKQWLPEHFSALVRRLVDEDEATCVLVGGQADAATTAAVRDAARAGADGRVIDLAGRTSLGELAGVLSLAAVCVSNDSGAMHVAGALGTPVVAMFGPTRERETAPLVWRDRSCRVLTAPVDCRPCMLRACPIDHRCMSRIQPEAVREAVLELGRPGAAR